MTWNPTLLNIRFRPQAVITPQVKPQDCLPYWWRNTDGLDPVIIIPKAPCDGKTLDFDVFDPETEKPMNVTKTMFLLDAEGLNVFVDLPSTVMEWVRKQVPGQHCLCFMTKKFRDQNGIPSAVVLTGPGEGKWPRTAALDNAKLIAILTRVMNDPALSKLLEPHERKFLDGLKLSKRAE